LSKDCPTTKSINIWSEDGSDIGEEDVSFQVRLLLEFESEIPAEKNTLVFEMLLDSWQFGDVTI
jgi:hypothetical protein